MTWLQRNVRLAGRRPMSPWRFLSLLTWRSVGEASVYALLEIEADPLLAFIAARNDAGVRPRITVVHCVGKAVAEVFRRYPDINCLLRWGRIDRRRDVDVLFTVALDREGHDLSGVAIRQADRMDVAALAAELSLRARELRETGDPSFDRLRSGGAGTRTLTRLMMRYGGFLLYTLNLWSPRLGFPRDRFGSAAVTDVSRFACDVVYAPLLPPARLPFLVAVGPIHATPVPDADEPGRWTTGKKLRLTITFDHRIIDGVYGGHICRLLRDIFQRPEAYLDEVHEGNRDEAD